MTTHTLCEPYRLNGRLRVRAVVCVPTKLCVWTLAGLAAVLGSPGAAGQCHYTYVEVPNVGAWTCLGQAINNVGEVAGYALSGGDNARAFIWSPQTASATSSEQPPAKTPSRASSACSDGSSRL